VSDCADIKSVCVYIEAFTVTSKYI